MPLFAAPSIPPGRAGAGPAPGPAAGAPLRRRGEAPISAVMASFDDILADFAFLDDWDDRYKYLIDLGRKLAPYPQERRDEAHKVKGCASQVWLAHDVETQDGETVLRFRGDSDAHIVKGLIAVLLALYDGKTPREILKADAPAALAPLDLEGHLTPQRSNGLAAMVKRITEIAAAAEAEAA